MEKDIFNGKVKAEHRKSVKKQLVSCGVLGIATGTLFLLTALLYDNLDYDLQIALFVMTAIAYLFAIWQLLTILCIRKYPKLKIFLKGYIKNHILIDVDGADGSRTDLDIIVDDYIRCVKYLLNGKIVPITGFRDGVNEWLMTADDGDVELDSIPHDNCRLTECRYEIEALIGDNGYDEDTILNALNKKILALSQK